MRGSLGFDSDLQEDDMKGSETRLVAYMQGANNRFVIPVYQRNYDWKTENCKQLFDDLIKVVREHRKSHFFGSIVSVHNPDAEGGHNEFLVIDGQQRLTTVSLLLLAMYNLMKKGIVIPAKATLGEQIYETYLVDKWQDDDARIKLKPVKSDKEAFNRLFGDEADYIQEPNLTANYKFFYERIRKEEISVSELYDAICRLEIISITLNQDDDPQLIFESLNSTGVALSEGDKIRNFILMGLPSKEQNDYYEKYWNRIEQCTDYDVSSFVRDWLSVKQQATPAISRIYYTFKLYVEDEKTETETLLTDLLSYAKRYEMLLHGNRSNKDLNACISRLNRLETTVTRPFFLEVLRLYDDRKLTKDEVTTIFLTTETYLFRRSICDLPTNTLSKIFLTLHMDIIRFDGTDDDYVAKFKYVLLSKKERTRFPLDSEFAEAFATRPIYQMNSKSKVYALERLENYGTMEDKDIYRHVDDGEYSIEHIMPQHLSNAWIDMLGENYIAVHEEWLHRIANLTLTAYNSKYSNSSFFEKKTMNHGFIDSGIRMNQEIARCDKWTIDEIKDRSEKLSQRALIIWQLPTTDFVPTAQPMDTYSLDDDMDLSGRVIVRFALQNAEQPVTSWIEMFESVMKSLHARDETVLSKLAYEESDNDAAAYVSNNPDKLRSACEIRPGLYVEKNTSTPAKLAILRKFFKLYGVDPTDLIFTLRDDSDDSSDTESTGARFELRRKYWTYALNIIKFENADKIFSNVNVSKENWISGFFGVNGFNISCVANYDSARVDLYLGSKSKEYNKEVYDKLLSHRQELESKLDTALIWYRNDEAKSSKISVVLDGVSIESESDWSRMAKFHAEWSKKFYDVMVSQHIL